MARYCIGDIQGCYEELRRLLEVIRFDPAADQLWFVGDLVNRGPNSVEVLRLVQSLGASAIVVLGNHDLHLLAVATDAQRHKPHKGDTLDNILSAPDRDELLDWLRRRPLLHDADGWLMIHAGLPPQWDLSTARACAREVEAVLGSDDYVEFIRHMYGNEPSLWDEQLAGEERLRFSVNCLTRMRYVDAAGRLEFHQKSAPGKQPPDLLPWFRHPRRRCRDVDIVFGHWSTLGFRIEERCYAIDTGCLWGGELSALRLPDSQEPLARFAVPSTVSRPVVSA